MDYKNGDIRARSIIHIGLSNISKEVTKINTIIEGHVTLPGHTGAVHELEVHVAGNDRQVALRNCGGCLVWFAVSLQ